jgi:fructoselysine-6-P-deglycase FrlB-like protein
MERPPWYDAHYPEFRTGPPWVMEDMIASQAELPSAILRETGPATTIALALRERASRGEPIVTTGCGTGGHAAQAVAALVNEAGSAMCLRDGIAQWRPAFEAMLEPSSVGLLIAVSHGGRTRATVAALEAARARGATTALITAHRDTPAETVADHILMTGLADRSWCHTAAYLGPIIAGGLVAARLIGTEFDASTVRAAIVSALVENDAFDELARGLDGVERVVVVGSGVDLVAARELALKLCEGVWLPTAAHETEEVLHGHLVAHDERSALILLATTRSGSRLVERARGLLGAARRIGLCTAAIATAELGGELDAGLTSAGRIIVEDSAALPPRFSSLVASAVALQRLTVAMARARGRNPDLLRREQAPYREAAVLAEAKLRPRA